MSTELAEVWEALGVLAKEVRTHAELIERGTGQTFLLIDVLGRVLANSTPATQSAVRAELEVLLEGAAEQRTPRPSELARAEIADLLLRYLPTPPLS